MTYNSTLKSILTFMQSNDRNGTYLEWYDEIVSNESELDKEYIISVLNSWLAESKETKYADMILLVESL